MTTPKTKDVSDSGGFSLVEILVVMAVMAALVALLFPMLGKVRERSATARCVGQLKTVVLAAMLFSGDHDGSFPASVYWNSRFDKEGELGIREYLGFAEREARGADTVLTCPSLQATHPTSGYAFNHNYAINRYATAGRPDSRYQKMTAVTEPAAMAFFMDSCASGRTAEKGYYFAASVKEADRVSFFYPHRDTLQVVFVDGHVEGVTREEIAGYDRTSLFWSSKWSMK